MTTTTEVDNYLAHYGIKGMQWGVRKADDSSGGGSSKKEKPPKKINEAKAKRFDTRAQVAQTQINLIQAHPSKIRYVQNQRNARVRELEFYRDQQKKNAKDVRDGHLTDGEKKLIKGAAITTALLAAYGTYKYVDSGAAHRTNIKGKELLSKSPHSWSKNDALKGDLNLSDIMGKVVPGVNPEYGSMGTKMNCRRCTFAYEMRRRGYDVKATKSVGATGQTTAGLINAMDPNSKLKTGRWGIAAQMVREMQNDGGALTELTKSGGWGKTRIGGDLDFRVSESKVKADRIFGALSKEPNGARGELGVGWTFGGGHSMAWEIVQGKPVIFDTQTGKTYKDSSDFKKFAEAITDAGYTRLDNLDLNSDFLLRWLDNAK